MNNQQVIIKQLGLQPYLATYQLMHDFTQKRTEHTIDEIWLVQHPPVFTQGKVGKAEHLLQATEIPVIHTDRGGQITYHAPGQQIMYILLDLKRLATGIRQTVAALEDCVIATLKQLQIEAYAKADAPGVYVAERKICSLGLHIQHGRTLHGLALNVNMDLQPFSMINPCGYAGLQMTQVADLTENYDPKQISQSLVKHFTELLGYRHCRYQ